MNIEQVAIKVENTGSTNQQPFIRAKVPTKDSKCPYCQRTFTRANNLYWHVKDKKCLKKRITPANCATRFECSNCKHVFANKRNFAHHINRRVCFKIQRNAVIEPRPKRPKILSKDSCPHCQRTFSRPNILYWHIKDRKCLNKQIRLANRLKSLCCSNCEQIFSSKQKLIHHVNKRICFKKLQTPNKGPLSKSLNLSSIDSTNQLNKNATPLIIIAPYIGYPVKPTIVNLIKNCSVGGTAPSSEISQSQFNIFEKTSKLYDIKFECEEILS